MTFGQAIESLKQGSRVRRSGWNGKGMWLALTRESYRAFVEHDGPRPPLDSLDPRGALRVYAETEQPNTVKIGAHIDMRAADGTLVIGWLASQTDMLAEDWEVVG